MVWDPSIPFEGMQTMAYRLHIRKGLLTLMAEDLPLNTWAFEGRSRSNYSKFQVHAGPGIVHCML